MSSPQIPGDLETWGPWTCNFLKWTQTTVLILICLFVIESLLLKLLRTGHGGSYFYQHSQADAGRSKGYPWLQGELKDSLGYVRLLSKN